MEEISLVEQNVVLSPKEYNVLLAQLASRVANALVLQNEDRNPARSAVLVAIEIMERSGLRVLPPQPSAQPVLQATPQAAG